jgi:hypothetical protein
MSDNLFKRHPAGTPFIPASPLTEEQRQDAFLREHSPRTYAAIHASLQWAHEFKAGNAELQARLDASNREAACRDKLGILGRLAVDIKRGKELLKGNGNRRTEGVTVPAAVMAPTAGAQMSRTAHQ